MPTPSFQKRATWDADLRAYIDVVRGTPFEFGVFDCSTFAAGAVEAMTGVDPAAGFRGQYGGAESGLALVHAAGYLDHVDMAAALFDTVKNRTTARFGDLAAVQTEAGLALGVVIGATILAPTLRGLGALHLTDAKRVFRVAG
jgi:hypothetical protein